MERPFLCLGELPSKSHAAALLQLCPVAGSYMVEASRDQATGRRGFNRREDAPCGSSTVIIVLSWAPGNPNGMNE